MKRSDVDLASERGLKSSGFKVKQGCRSIRTGKVPIFFTLTNTLYYLYFLNLYIFRLVESEAVQTVPRISFCQSTHPRGDDFASLG